MSKTDRDKIKFIRPAIKQHKDLLTDLQYKHRVEVGKKVRLSKLEEKDFNLELKEYLYHAFRHDDP